MISVVVTSYTIARLTEIRELLRSLARQTNEGVEVVFVVEREPQLEWEVRRIFEEYGLKGSVVAAQHERGLSACRNLGVGHSTGGIVAFLVDDVVVAPDWATALAQAFEDVDVIGLGGSVSPLGDEKELEWLPREFYWVIGCTDWFAGWPGEEIRNPWGMNMAFRKEVFDVVGGFHAKMGLWGGDDKVGWLKLSGEEVVFAGSAKRFVGGKIIYDPRVQAWHKIRSSSRRWDVIAKQAFRIGYSRTLLKRAFPGQDTLATEKKLLGVVVQKVLPRLLMQGASRPGLVVRQTSTTVLVMFALGIGYGTGLILRPRLDIYGGVM